MSTTIQQRMSGRMTGEFVVFLIGMRVNRWWKVHQWMRVAAAMPRMIRELSAKPELGLLGAEAWFGRTTIMLQYWRSMDALLDYAKNRDAEHLPAWRAFNKMVGTNGDVGIWHETYRVRPGDYEGVYVNMSPFGLGRAGELVPARARAIERLQAAHP
jgi:Monooxygenase af470-like